jgi:CheY-like chemotaxis protein
VRSEPGKGSSFRVLLPSVGAPAPAAVPTTASRGNWRGSGKVLVIDDEEVVRVVIAQVLEQLGFEPILAADGADGIETFRAHAQETVCVLLDMTMPRMGGEEAFREIRKIRADARVVLMSGYTEHSIADAAVGTGIAAFLQKPFRPEDLLDKVRAAVGVRIAPGTPPDPALS